MRLILKLLIFSVIGIVLYTLYANYSLGNPWTKEALTNQLGITLGIVQEQGKVVGEVASTESGRVLGEMTSRMATEPIWKAITGTIGDEARAVPYNICKPIVEEYNP